jgi:hypothetical protein
MTQVSERATAQEVKGTSIYEAPGRPGSIVTVKTHYENFIGGHWLAGRRLGDLGEREIVDGALVFHIKPSTGASSKS